MAIAFFCTRCRTLLQYPDGSVGSVIYCPRCQQAVIVPGILQTDLEDGVLPPEVNAGQEDAEDVLPGVNELGAGSVLPGSESDEEKSPPSDATQELPTGAIYGLESEGDNDFSVPMISHLTARASAKVDTSQPPDDPFVVQQIADDEFLNRVEMSSGVKAAPVAPQMPGTGEIQGGLFALPIPPPVVGEEDGSESEEDEEEHDLEGEERPARRLIPMPILIILGCAAVMFAAASGIWLFHELRGGAQVTPVASRPVPIDGQVVYANDRNPTLPDEGSVVLVLPQEVPEGGPLVLGNLVPGNITDSDLRRAREKLVPAGGAIAMVDANGLFDLTVTRPGPYHVLIVSGNVYQKGDSGLDALKQDVSQFLFQPGDTLLSARAFFWEVRELDHKNYHLQYSFGSKDGKFPSAQAPAR
ncbi:MAG: LSD1-type zinc finger protein [Planctomycetia bacterium]|nr:LSD1-type zinc finger protein [Planctomycetia bacterium]